MKKDTWLIVANNSVAHIYKVHKKPQTVELVHLETLEHPEGRLHNRDINSDRPGRDFESMGTGRHSLEPRISPKQQENIHFAKQIANRLEAGRTKGEYEHFYLASAPSLLGLIRQSLSSTTSKLIEGETDKDIAHLKSDEIVSHLPFFF